jgi:hypothetical protein
MSNHTSRHTPKTVSGVPQLFRKILKQIGACKRLTTCFVALAVGGTQLASAQTDPAEMIRKDFPDLWSYYGQAAMEQKADYIIAVDVSGSMKRFREVVLPNVAAFLESLPNGDYVSIIAFGTGVRLVGVPAQVNAASRPLIRGSLDSIGFTDQNTDLAAMARQVLDELNRPAGNSLKFVFAFTDFDHDPPAATKGKEEWDRLKDRFRAENSKNKVEFYAMKLALTEKSGRDLQKIEGIFPGLQIIPVNPATLGGWFQRRKAEILRDRLKYVVEKSINGPAPSLAFSASGQNLSASLSQGTGALLKGLRIDSVRGGGSLPMAMSPLPMSIKTGEKATISRYAGGACFEKEMSLGQFELVTYWETSAELPEIQRLGISLPEAPIRVEASGQWSPPGRLEFRVVGNNLEGRFEAAGYEAKITEARLPDVGALISLFPRPWFVNRDWQKFGEIPVSGILGREFPTGKLEGTISFVTNREQNVEASAQSLTVEGDVVLGRFALWQVASAAGLLGLVFLYILFTYRPGKKFGGKITRENEGGMPISVRLDRSHIKLEQGEQVPFKNICAGFPANFTVHFKVKGDLFHPIRGRRVVYLTQGTAIVRHRGPGGKEISTNLRMAGAPFSPARNLTSWTLSSGQTNLRWSKN